MLRSLIAATLLFVAITPSSAIVQLAQQGLEVESLATESAAQGGPRFTRLDSEESGVDFVSRLLPNHPLSFLYHSGMSVSGIAAGDLNGDGRVDLYLANGPDKNKLFLQGADGKFRDATAEAGPGLDGGDDWASGVSLADVDNDGDLDLYVCNYEKPNKLFLNNGPSAAGGVTFTEAAEPAGLAIVDASHAAAFCDYDNDGDLDLYLLTNRVDDPDGMVAELPVEFEGEGRVKVRPDAERYYDKWVWDKENWGTEPMGRPDYLFRNDGPTANGTPQFTEVTSTAGIFGRGDGLSVVWWDADLDGDSDLYVANDFIAPDRFYRNNGDGTFTNIVAEAMAHTTWFSMGSDFGDLDNDGDFDLLVADMSATTHYKSKVTMGAMGGLTLQRANSSQPPQYMRNALHLNEGQIHGELRFREAAYLAKLASSDWTWTVKLQDFDSDGRLDVYMTNGVAREMNHSDYDITPEMLVGKHIWEFYKDGDLRKEENLAWQNQGDLHFKPIGKQWGLDHNGASYGAVHCDLEGDGDLDMVVMNLEEQVSVYRNDGPSGSRVTIRLRGTRSNSHGIGALVTLEAAGQQQVRQLVTFSGFQASNQPILHFGLGDATKIDRLTIHWPGGGLQEYTDLPVNKRLTITQTNSQSPGKPEADEKTWFVASDLLEDAWHQDPEYDDYQHQSLLPHALSHLGPGMAWGDVDGNGSDDLFTCGGAGQPGQLRLRQPNGTFKLSLQQAFTKDRKCEGQDALFLDIDSDGDLDLFVASGSYEFETGDEAQRNRLYLNDGSGNFSRAEFDDPCEFTGTLAAGDYDGDGDPDLFVGTRSKQGEFPAPQTSRLLVNEKGLLRDATEEVAPDLIDTGMVTDALWADIDGDGRLDLVVAHEWGTIKVLRNDGAKLVPHDTGDMAAHTGWWYAVAAGDVDGDGDIDLVATNIGKNTKYKSSMAKPIETYFGDFEGTGQCHIVEVKKEGDSLYPERGRSCSSRAMPFIAKKFPTFHEFGLASLDQIYGRDKLRAADHFEANTFYSGVLLNDGSGKFEFKKLPNIAQISPGYDVSLSDLDQDGNLDVIIAQNSYAPQSETGHYDGGVGQILRGDGRGGFQPIAPALSGFYVRGDAKAVSLQDLDRDGAMDIVVTTNRGPVYTFLNRMPRSSQ